MIKVKKFIYKCKLIDDYLKENDVNKKKFCERCKICRSTLKRFYQGKMVSVLALLKVVEVLNVGADEFLINIIK